MNRLLFSCLLLIFLAGEIFPDDEHENHSSPISNLDNSPGNLDTARRRVQITALNTETVNLIRANNLAKASVNIDKIRKLDASSVEYHYLKGSYLYAQGKYPQAEDFLLKAVQIHPSHDPSYYLLGMIFVQKSKWAKSLEYFQKAAELSNYNPFYRINLALAYFETGNFLRAKAEAERAIELKPNFRAAKLLLLKSNFLLGNKADAYSQCVDFVKEGFISREYMLIHARLVMEIHQNYRKAIEIYTQYGELPFQEKRFLARAYYNIGNYRAAAITYQAIVQLKIAQEEDKIEYIRSLSFIKDYKRLESFVNSWLQEEPEKRSKILEILDVAELLKENDSKVFHMFPSRSPY
ncbi:MULTISPECIES: tetratricopeptide repeat protein [Leptospira]|uniref:Tetratricopeptide repeat protein n=2 Tax=Leptospira borgpetersenii TaxID=174 RepID=M6W2Q2_LEPBO|nr:MULTISPECIES: tetratricopeptide repeat protein [Leptospira]EMO61731.1 tetratricopeptide repeat protein [Leptospira borgpetersenii serovar Pomona str. 200901868]AXX16798.1 tetratricopeptide repeat protein [Leptospira borgpetersenii serovar Ceylonica]EKQ93998.1 tetratricopeptide repeat protein [Leptospira borgpetersenii str. UI 09149]EMK11633.1 tetratricopeptide repeat protein [Leptospira sp. serovar Kenya str. Sh9]EMN57225.1 tetratricopeptide repeat protein [Leptospira borgpetersenii serovar